MPLVPTAKPDGPRIRELIRDRGYSVTDFARRLARHPQAIWNITGYEPPTSEKFIRQIARELGVRPSDISDMTDEDVSDPEPKAPAA
jgi:hypothetical protein